MNKFFIKLFLFTVAIAILDFFWNSFSSGKVYIPDVWIIFSYFIFTTIVFHLLITNASKGRPQNFIRFYMASTAIRMLLCVIVVVIYRFANHKEVIPFAIGFMIHYLLFTCFEVPILLGQLKKQN